MESISVCNHRYDYKKKLDDRKSCYRLIIAISWFPQHNIRTWLANLTFVGTSESLALFDPGHTLSQVLELISSSPTQTSMHFWTSEPPRVLLHGSQIIIKVKPCTFPSLPRAEITRNCNGRTRSVKCSHFTILSVVNRPYFVSQNNPYNALSQRFLTQLSTA